MTSATLRRTDPQQEGPRDEPAVREPLSPPQ